YEYGGEGDATDRSTASEAFAGAVCVAHSQQLSSPPPCSNMPACFLTVAFGVRGLIMADKTVGVCLLGCGIVGGGVERILREQRTLLRQRTGIDLELRDVVVKDREAFPANHADLPISTDANAAIDDPRSDVIIEL